MHVRTYLLDNELLKSLALVVVTRLVQEVDCMNWFLNTAVLAIDTWWLIRAMSIGKPWRRQDSGLNGVARIFFWGGPIFRDLLRPTRFGGGGGGVVAEIFRDRRKPCRFSGGGGGSRNFPGSP